MNAFKRLLYSEAGAADLIDERQVQVRPVELPFCLSLAPRWSQENARCQRRAELVAIRPHIRFNKFNKFNQFKKFKKYKKYM